MGAVAPLLVSCGFHPLYAPRAGGAAGPAQAGLSEISVGVIAERSGQLLRQDLQERFERGGVSVTRRYDLVVTFAMSGEGIGIQPDNSLTFVRMIGTANWKLVAQDPQRTTLASGAARVVDGLNVLNEQYFASDLETEAVQRRIAEAVADQITLKLAAYFERKAAGDIPPHDGKG